MSEFGQPLSETDYETVGRGGHEVDLVEVLGGGTGPGILYLLRQEQQKKMIGAVRYHRSWLRSGRVEKTEIVAGAGLHVTWSKSRRDSYQGPLRNHASERGGVLMHSPFVIKTCSELCKMIFHKHQRPDEEYSTELKE